MEGLIDLHVHTTASDGTMSPKDVVKYAKQKGIIALSITDHDTVAGIEEACNVGEALGIEIIPGIELSVEYEKEMHILGYYIRQTQVLKDKLKKLREIRNDRNLKIIQRLKEMGINISWEELFKISNGEAIGRPHIAMLLVQKGYVDSIDSAFKEYVGEGKKAYIKNEKIQPEEGIKLILEAGGIPVLAHPKYLNLNKNELNILLIKLKKIGLKGLEVYYSMHTNYEVKVYLELAKKHELIVTGGTDFHGQNKSRIDIGVGKGKLRLDYNIIEDLKNLL